MIFLIPLFIFLCGLCIGSFLNVVIFRLETNETLWGRSHCLNCRHPLTWIDLIPLISFLLLGGKCRYCATKISIQYPIVEIVTALIFLLIFNSKFLIFNQFQILQFLNLLFLWYVASSLIVIFVYDLKHFIIPDKILFPAIVVAAVFQMLNVKLQISNYVLAMLVASGFFLIIYVISKGRWMGFGDVKLAILLGLILGWPLILVGLFLSFFAGAIGGILLIAVYGRTLKSHMPFAPFLIIGTITALAWGQTIMQWYMNFLM